MKKLFYIILIGISMLIFSCQRSTDIGYTILPEGDLLNVNITDTLTVEVHTLKTDSVVTSGVSQLLLGEYTDPIFGYSKASFVMQFSLAQFTNFKDTDIVDSVILTLPYNPEDNNVYGNASKEQTIEVYQINTDLDNSINYYGNQNPADYMGKLVGSMSYSPFPEDTLLNIKLYNSLGDTLIHADESNYISDQSFHNFFKGLYIKAESANDDGAIVKFNISDASLLSVYFHKNDTSNTALVYKITANNIINTRFNLFEHDYSSADFAGTIDDESLPQDSLAYIQSGGGLYARIKFPSLKNMSNLGNIVINRAELIINTAPENLTSENLFPAINKLYITGYISDNSSILIPDYITQTSYTGETYSDKTYRFDIAAYIQDILSGRTENNGINLYTTSDGVDISRSVITTGSNSNPMKLVITYTKL